MSNAFTAEEIIDLRDLVEDCGVDAIIKLQKKNMLRFETTSASTTISKTDADVFYVYSEAKDVVDDPNSPLRTASGYAVGITDELGDLIAETLRYAESF